jgi:Flp pilus assembly protein TadB
MFTTLMTYWQRLAQLIYDALLPYLPRELATVLALLWPAFVVILLLAGLTLLFTWLDRRALNRHLNRRLAQLHAELDKEGIDH